MGGLIQLVLFIFPAAAIILGFLGLLVFKNIWIMPLFVALVSSTLMFTVFNTTFIMGYGSIQFSLLVQGW